MSSGSCIFCKIVRGEIPSVKVMETPLTLAFMDIQPLAKRHVLVVPKSHGQFLHQIPDDNMQDVGVVLKKVAGALSLANHGQQYNVLQNNGPLAHQEVPHVHFHIIPKESPTDGLILGKWDAQQGIPQDQLKKWAAEIQDKL